MLDVVMSFIVENASKLLIFLAVLILAAIAVKVSHKLLYKLLDKSNIPSASLFINIVRVLIWATALTMVLQPVFGINPTTFLTALGVGGVALSLGMQDTIANIVSGFGLMLGKVIKPGDMVGIQGIRGIVSDVTWRQTVIQERGGNFLVIPNALLNTSSFEKITQVSESCVVVPFIAKGNSNPDEIEAKILELVREVDREFCMPDESPLVKFSGFSPYGVKGELYLFARFDQFPSTVANAATRALMGADFLVQTAAADISA